MNRNYLTAKSICGVIGGILFILFGLNNLWINYSNFTKNYEFISNADMVVGECMATGDGSNSNHSYLRTIVTYVYEEEKYENVIVENYGQMILKGDKVNLFVNPEHPRQCVMSYKTSDGDGATYTLFTIIGLGAGVVCFFIGVTWLRKLYFR